MTDDDTSEYDFDKRKKDIKKAEEAQKRTNTSGGGSRSSTPAGFVDPSRAHERGMSDEVPLDSSSSNNARKKSTNGTGTGDPSTYSEKVFNEEINQEFKLAQEAARDGDYGTAIAITEEILKSPVPTAYSLRIQSIKSTWEKQKEAKEKVSTLWKKHELDEVQSTEFEKRFGKAVSEIHKDEQLDDDVKKHMKSFMRNRGNELKKEKGDFGGYFTIADDVSKITEEGRKLADDALTDVNPSKLERGIARLEQAKELALENGLNKQARELIPLIQRYKANYKDLFELFKISEKGRASPWATHRINYLKDDSEVQRDDLNALATKLDLFRSRKDKGSQDEMVAALKNIKKKYPNTTEFKELESLLGPGAIKRANEKNTKDAFEADAKETLESVNAEAERAKRLGELYKEYPDRHLKKAEDVRNKFRDRSISGHEHWGAGGTAVVDAAEWIGFDRNPIETIGNLAATIITWWIVVNGIVGPILDTFSFFIPFIGILKVPIYLIAIIILHPFMKTILHPIKMDLHFLAGDPYWYKEGTAVDKVRSTAYEAGSAISEKATAYNDAEKRMDVYRGAKKQAGEYAQKGTDLGRRGKDRLDEYRKERRLNKEVEEMEKKKRKEEAAKDVSGSA